MSRSRIFFILLLFYIVGVFARSFSEINFNVYFLLLFLAISLCAIFYKDKKIVIVSFAALFFVFGAWNTDNKVKNADNLAYLGKTFQKNAVVIKNSSSASGQNIIAELSDLSPDKERLKIAVLLQAPQYPEYVYGDLLDVTCIVKAIENLPAVEAGKDADFDYRMYMAKEGVLYMCDKPKIRKIASNHGNWLYGKIIATRKIFEEKIIRVIPMPEGALADGLLFGGNAGLSKELQSDFSRTGMTHIVAVSGYNVTIIAEYLIILGIFLGMWRPKAIWFALFGIILFVIMSGLPASAVRAGVMGSVLLWAMKNGRLADSKNAIIFAAAVMLMQNPLLLRWDVGFQLSFLATLGIVETSPLWEKSFIKKNKALGISEAIALSLSAQLFVLPIITYNFHITSLISLLANVFILPIIPISMLLVLLVSLTGFVFPFLSMVLAWLAFVPLAYEIRLIHMLSQFPWASIQIEKVSALWVAEYYLVLFLGLQYFKNGKTAELEKIINPSS